MLTETEKSTCDRSIVVTGGGGSSAIQKLESAICPRPKGPLIANRYLKTIFDY